LKLELLIDAHPFSESNSRTGLDSWLIADRYLPISDVFMILRCPSAFLTFLELVAQLCFQTPRGDKLNPKARGKRDFCTLKKEAMFNYYMREFLAWLG